MSNPEQNMKCDHEKMVRAPVIVSHDYYGDAEWEMQEQRVNTYEDVDLHRYQCTLCGEMFYYSSRAREFFEQGIEHEQYGLTVFNLLKHGGKIPKNY